MSLKSVSTKDIENIEIELALSLAEEYKKYIQGYGAIIADTELLFGRMYQGKFMNQDQTIMLLLSQKV